MVLELHDAVLIAKLVDLLFPLGDKVDYLQGHFAEHEDMVEQLHYLGFTV